MATPLISPEEIQDKGANASSTDLIFKLNKKDSGADLDWVWGRDKVPLSYLVVLAQNEIVGKCHQLNLELKKTLQLS